MPLLKLLLSFYYKPLALSKMCKKKWCFMKSDGCDYIPKMATLGFYTEIYIMVVKPLFRAYSTKILLISLGLLIWKVYKFYSDMWEIEKLSTFNRCNFSWEKGVWNCVFHHRHTLAKKTFAPKLVMGLVDFCLFV